MAKEFTAKESAIKAEPAGLLMVAAKALQSFVLGSDKLREMVGATQLIEDFCSRGQVSQLIESGGIPPGNFELITCAAGQVVVRFNSISEARKLAAVWPWAVHCLAPGLEIHCSVQEIRPEPGAYLAAVNAAQEELGLSRSLGPARHLPPAAPPVLRARRSGGAAVAYDTFSGETEEVDAVARRKRRRRACLRRQASDEADGHPIFEAFSFDPDSLPKDLADLLKVPLRLKDASGATKEASNTISARQPCLAVVHADGNGLGQTFIELAHGLASAGDDEAIAVIRDFSDRFRETGLEASRLAIDRLLGHFSSPLPILPVVLAGDDLTVIMRGELAIPFVRHWLQAFEELTMGALKALKENHPRPGREISAVSLSGGAGIVFCGSSQPIVPVYDQCESLAKLAKDEAKKRCQAGVTVPASLAFHRVFGSVAEGYDERNGAGVRLSGNPYYLNAGDGPSPRLDDLRGLRDALACFPTGSVRHLLSEMRSHPDAAPAWFERMCRVMQGRKGGGEKVEALRFALKAIHGKPDGLTCESPRIGESPTWSAIPDAITWRSVEPILPAEIYQNKPTEEP